MHLQLNCHEHLRDLWITSPSNTKWLSPQHDLQTIHNASDYSYQHQDSKSWQKLTYTTKETKDVIQYVVKRGLLHGWFLDHGHHAPLSTSTHIDFIKKIESPALTFQFTCFFCIHHTFFWTLLIAKSQYFIAIHKSKINSMKTIICVLTTTSAYQSFRVHGIVIEKIDDVWHSLMVLNNNLLAFHRYNAKYDQHCVACF